jgi:hypothetical protein
MTYINFAVTMFNVLGFICIPATLILAILWFLQPEKNYEPITVALGSASVIFLAAAQVIQLKYPSQESQQKNLNDLTTDGILVVVKVSNPDEWDVSFSQGADIAVLKKNPSLRIETRHTDEFLHNDDFHEKWANKFPDPHATSYYYHVYLGATRLKEFILVSVDGGRALLPLPINALDLRVDPLRYKIALIFDRFDSYDEYMKKAGLHLVKNKDY